ncbi:IclR family transcriptional regulator [Cetobacterium sp. 2A]|uniref:IclR family transcriptional regulator n=1 Tax=unclassified Cetobacterium TaxID=2630983 RepID=UPI00163CFBD6|nr:IclR family transcriptional regulator [Cetobacterium sp. 2A]MBC2857302.1 IclR family transcriptional regulator [Cetobacterium sp. 2A]
MEGKTIQSVQRAIDIINCFTEDEHELSLKDISNKLELSKSTVHGIISTLIKNSFLQQNKISSDYSLGAAFIEKSFLVDEDVLLKNIGRKYLESLSNEFNVTVNIFLFKSLHLHLIDRVSSLSMYYSISTSVKKIPLNASASGKLALAYSKEINIDKIFEKNLLHKYTNTTITDKKTLIEEIEVIRKQGYSLEQAEVEIGIHCISVPIFKINNEFIGTISIMATKEKLNQILSKLVPKMLAVGKKLSAELGNK